MARLQSLSPNLPQVPEHTLARELNGAGADTRRDCSTNELTKREILKHSSALLLLLLSGTSRILPPRAHKPSHRRFTSKPFDATLQTCFTLGLPEQIILLRERNIF